MRVLIVGGTVFLGRHVVESLLARGHEIVLFHRGTTGAELYPQCERILADRETGIERIGDRRFDAVVDTSGYVPHVVRASATYLASRASRYLFVSTINAYASTKTRVDEDAPEAALPDGADAGTFDPEHYGPLKVLCEREVRSAFGESRALVVRPGLIVGAYDPTDRYTYWVDRIARGGDVVAPRDPSFPAQYIDARDLARWIVALLENERSGTFNAVPPANSFTLGATLDAIALATESDARFVWMDEAFLAAHDVAPWTELPLWIPQSADMPYFFSIDSSRAIATGLHTSTPLETARATFAWLPARGDRPWKAGLSAERERTLLDAWSARIRV